MAPKVDDKTRTDTTSLLHQSKLFQMRGDVSAVDGIHVLIPEMNHFLYLPRFQQMGICFSLKDTRVD
jgi:hypothetical protein